MPQGISWFSRFLREDNNFLDPIINNLDPRNPSYPYTSVWAALVAALAGLGVWRVLLTTATSFYVNTATGNNSNPGTIASPWASLSPLGSRYDFGNQLVTANILNNGTVGLQVPTWVGGGGLVIDGGNHSVSPASGDALSVGQTPGDVTVQNISLAGPGNALSTLGSTTVRINPSVTFGASGVHMASQRGGTIVIQASYTVSGVASQHWRADVAGNITTSGAVVVTNTAGAVAYGVFARATNGGLIQPFNVSFSGFAGVTGTQYVADFDGLINTGNRGQNFLPGTANSGTTTLGGIYQ